jgi:hypothetical protein
MLHEFGILILTRWHPTRNLAGMGDGDLRLVSRSGGVIWSMYIANYVSVVLGTD